MARHKQLSIQPVQQNPPSPMPSPSPNPNSPACNSPQRMSDLVERVERDDASPKLLAHGSPTATSLLGRAAVSPRPLEQQLTPPPRTSPGFQRTDSFGAEMNYQAHLAQPNANQPSSPLAPNGDPPHQADPANW